MRVPTYDNFQVAPQSMPQPRFNPNAIVQGVDAVATTARASQMPQPGTFRGANHSDRAARETQALGDQMQAVGKQAMEYQIAAADEANQLRVADGLNQVLKARTDMLLEASQIRGKSALERPDGKALPDEYVERLQSFSGEIAQGLGNDAQRMAFSQGVAKLQGEFYGMLGRHMVAQQQAYRVQTREATVDAALDQVGRAGADDGLFSESMELLKATVYKQVEEEGGDEAIASSSVRKLTDKAYELRYKAWAQEDPVAALANFQQHRESIGPLMRDRIGDDLFRSAEPMLADMVKPWMTSVGTVPMDRPDLAKEPRGIRNNNPGNVRLGGSNWQGEVQGSDPSYATFSSPEAGIRAMGKNLLTYQQKYDLRTVEGIISRWAPASENDTASYVSTVAKALGVRPDAQIDLSDPDTMGRMVTAMIRVENGKQPYTPEQVGSGVAAALGMGTLPKAAETTSTPAQPNWRNPDAKTGVPLIDALSPDKRLKVFQQARTQMSQTFTQAREALSARVQDSAAEYMARGVASNPPEEAEFIRTYGQIEGLRRHRELQETAALGAELQRVKTLPNASLDQMLVDAKPRQGEGFAQRQKNFEVLQKAVAEVKEARQKDPVQFALENSAFGFEPLLDFKDGNAVGQELSRRAAAMDHIAASYGTRPAIFTNQEAAALGRFLEGLQAPERAGVLGKIASAAGPVGVQSLSLQLKDKNNVLSVAAMLSSHRTTLGNDAASLYLQGRDAIEQKRAKIDAAAETGIKAEIFKAIDGVYQTPQGRDAAAEAAYGIYAKLKSDGDDDVQRAVRLATGGIMEFNGSRIAKPYGWDDGRFRDALTTTVPDALTRAGGEYVVMGQKVKAPELAQKLPAARLQTYGQGSYLIITGGDVVRSVDGKPFILKVAP